jgi:hypothetical protein
MHITGGLDVLRASNVRRVLVRTCNFGLLCGVTVWVILIVKGAESLRGLSVAQDYTVQLGPFVLTHITKHPTPGGFTAGFSLESGLMWYILAWLTGGVFLGLVVLYIEYRKSSKSSN